MAAVGKRAWELYRLLITLIALACVAQIYLAGRGVFGIRGSASLADQTSFDPHRTLGNVIAFASVAAFVLALVLWDRRLILSMLILAVLAEGVQHATTTTEHPWVAGLHAVSGVMILGLAGSSAFRAWRHRGVAEATT